MRKAEKQQCLLKGIDPRVYAAWTAMRSRCTNITDQRHYKNYGDRGIYVCKRWASFAAFAEDMGPHPGFGWSLDRKDNNKGYYKRNCRWATTKMQSRNRRTTKLTEDIVDGIRQEYIRGTGPFNRGNGYIFREKYQISQSLLSHIITDKLWKPDQRKGTS